ncbi:MAG: ComF family protein [Elusimicrobia bacterium]|nr:ComF family protein [Elusimicrobiota bacterium]
MRPLETQSSPHYAYGRFEGTLRNLIMEFKYQQKSRLSHTLAPLLYQIWKRISQLRESEVFVPVPLHPARLRERGYNQSLLLAQNLRELIRQDSRLIPVAESALLRTRNSPPQAHLPRAERIRNMESLFEVRNPAAILDKNVLLIDDVCTTGTTLQSCAQVLLRAKAKKVLSLTVALA